MQNVCASKIAPSVLAWQKSSTGTKGIGLKEKCNLHWMLQSYTKFVVTNSIITPIL